MINERTQPSRKSASEQLTTLPTADCKWNSRSLPKRRNATAELVVVVAAVHTLTHSCRYTHVVVVSQRLPTPITTHDRHNIQLWSERRTSFVGTHTFAPRRIQRGHFRFCQVCMCRNDGRGPTDGYSKYLIQKNVAVFGVERLVTRLSHSNQHTCNPTHIHMQHIGNQRI